MIAHLQGKLVEKTPTQVVIDCGGVGYHVNISLHTYSLLPATDFIKLIDKQKWKISSMPKWVKQEYPYNALIY